MAWDPTSDCTWPKCVKKYEIAWRVWLSPSDVFQEFWKKVEMLFYFIFLLYFILFFFYILFFLCCLFYSNFLVFPIHKLYLGDPPRKIKFEFHFSNFRAFWPHLDDLCKLHHSHAHVVDSSCNATVFPNTLIYLWKHDTISTLTATNIHRPLPAAPASHTHKRDFSHIFSNFQTLLAAFFHKRYILTNLPDKSFFG